MEDTNISSSSDNDDVGFMGGALRGILRSVGYFTRIESIGRLPARIPHKVVSKSADRLGQLHENYVLVKEAYESARKSHPGSRIKSLLQTALLTSHGMLKSAILGGILFSIYEGIIQEFESMQLFSIPPDNNTFSLQNIVMPSIYTGLAGSFAGFTHGVLFSAWDRSVTAIPTQWWRTLDMHAPAAARTSYTLGTATSHLLVHGSLFGTYEFTKRSGLYLLGLRHGDEHLSRFQGGLCVLTGGMAAGVMSDLVGKGTRNLEEVGVRQTCLHLFHRPVTGGGEVWAWAMPSPRELGRMFRSAVKSAFPTALGFLAFEYAKDFTSASE